MILDNELPLNARPYEYIEPEPVTDYSMTDSIKASYSKDMITDVPYSERMNYSKTISGILGEDVPMNFNKEKLEYLDFKWDNGVYDYVDGQVVGNSSKTDTDNAAIMLKLKTKGYTADDVEKLALQGAVEEWRTNQKLLIDYSKTDPIKQLGGSMIGGIGSWLSDPINLGGLALEIGLFKGASGPKGMLREQRQWLERMGKSLSKMDFKMNTAAQILGLKFKTPKVAITEMFGIINKMPPELMKVGKASDNLLLLAKEGKLSPELTKLVKSQHFKSRLKEAMVIGGVSGALGGITEGAHQIGTLDWKERVYAQKGMPEYGKKQAKQDVELSAGFGFVFGALFNLGVNMLSKIDPVLPVVGGDEVTEQGFKAVSDITDNIEPNGDDIIIKADPDDYTKTETQGEVEIDTPDDIEKVDIESSQTELMEWNKVSQCMNQQ